LSFYLSEVVGSDSSDSSKEDLLDSAEVLDGPTLSISESVGQQRLSISRSPQNAVKTTKLPPFERQNRGPMSPFSPLMKSEKGKVDAMASCAFNTDANLSLISCRKVSVVITVNVPENNENAPKSSKLCLFPLVIASPSNPEDLLSPISATIQQAVKESTRELVVVNPSAFGKHIPAQFTMETARLVAQVANIESEDWARKYRFDEVVWSRGSEEAGSIGRLAESFSNDATLRHRNVVCFALGNLKGTSLFGSGGKPRLEESPSLSRSPESLGILGMTFNNILKVLPDDAVCTISFLEIADEETIRDMLSLDSIDSQSKLKIRHLDHRGALLQNLVDSPVDSLMGLDHLLRKAFYSQTALRIRKREGPRGHIICTFKIWENAVQRDLDHATKCVTLQFVELCNGHDSPGMGSTVRKRMASARKSLSFLRGVLRSLILQEINSESHSVSFRECTLTKILQRVLSEEGTQTVFLASVSAQALAYERTLHTLDYVNRLLIRPGTTAQSPFDRITPDSIKSSPVELLIDQRGTDEGLMKSVTSDPRQRLAKLLSKSPAKPRVTPKRLHLEESYQPTDYMAIDPGDISFVQTETPAIIGESNRVAQVNASENGTVFADDVEYACSESVETERFDIQIESPDFSPHNEQILWESRKENPYQKQPEFPGFLGEPNLAIQKHEMIQTTDMATNNTHSDCLIPLITPDDSTFYLEQNVDNEALLGEWLEEDLLERDFDNLDQEYIRFPMDRDGAVDPGNLVLERLVPQNDEGNCDGPALAGYRYVDIDFQPPRSKQPDSRPWSCEKAHDVSIPVRSFAHSSVSQSPLKSFNTVGAETESITSVHRSQMSSIDGTGENKRPLTETIDSTPFFSEIHNLQGTVDEVKRMQNGLWESSATSLERLQAFQDTQQKRFDEALAARLSAEHHAEEANKELTRRTDEYHRLQKKYEKEMANMNSILDLTIIERSSVEKIAEEAVMSQLGMERELKLKMEELSVTEQQLRQRDDEVERLTESYQQLMTDLIASEKKATELALDHSNCDVTIAELANQVEILTVEQVTLLERLTSERNIITGLKSENAQIVELKGKLDSTVKEIRHWKNACHEMKVIVSKQQSLSLQSNEVNDEELKRLNIEIAKLSQELILSQQHLVDTKTEHVLTDNLAKQEKLSLSNELRRERDQVNRLQLELESSQKARDDVVMNADNTSDLLNAEIKRLQSMLRSMTIERNQAMKHMTTMKETVEKFQRDTREQVARIVEEKRSMESTLATAVNDLKVCEDTKQKLTENLERCKVDQERAERSSVTLREQIEELEANRVTVEVENSDVSKKLGQLESSIDSMKRELDMVNNARTKSGRLSNFQVLQDMEERSSGGYAYRGRFADDPDASYPAELSLGAHRIRLLEKENEQLRVERASASDVDNWVSMEVFKAEQTRRFQAEDLTAMISARAKKGFEDRNDEIVQLKVRLSSIIDEKESEIRTLRSRMLEMEKQQIGTTQARSRRYHSDAGNDSRYWESVHESG